MDVIPVYGKEEGTPSFSGRRIHRGLYRSQDGTLLNGDINGAANILRKAFPNAFDDLMDFSFLERPSVYGFHEVNSCLNLIREYRSISPYILSELKESIYSKPILQLKHGDHDLLEGGENRILREIRGKYWDALFKDKRFTGNMTSNQYDQYSAMVHKLKDYDFNLFNIKTIQIEMAQNLVNGIEECILKLFDELSHEYSWLPETCRNIHFYNGWATNKAHIINKKVIIPVYNIFSKIWNRFEYRYDLTKKLSDIEKVFNYLSGSTNAGHYLDVILQNAEKEQQTKNINFKFFTVGKGRKELVLRWIAPTVVGTGERVATIHRVRNGQEDDG